MRCEYSMLTLATRSFQSDHDLTLLTFTNDHDFCKDLVLIPGMKKEKKSRHWMRKIWVLACCSSLQALQYIDLNNLHNTLYLSCHYISLFSSNNELKYRLKQTPSGLIRITGMTHLFSADHNLIPIKYGQQLDTEGSLPSLKQNL